MPSGDISRAMEFVSLAPDEGYHCRYASWYAVPAAVAKDDS
jgi:hypothetical protein